MTLFAVQAYWSSVERKKRKPFYIFHWVPLAAAHHGQRRYVKCKMRLRYLNLSAALIALICFFMPWVQVSCGGVKETMSGLDLARDGHSSLWFVPVFMSGVALLGIVRAWRRSARLFAVAGAACGLITAYLMNRERLRNEQVSDLIT